MRRTQYTMETCPPPGVASTRILVAMRIALRFQHRTPRPQELMAEFGMSLPTAYRWIAAMRAAKGEA